MAPLAGKTRCASVWQQAPNRNSRSVAGASERPVPSCWYTRRCAQSRCCPSRFSRAARRRDRCLRLPRSDRMGRLALRADSGSCQRLVLLVDGVGMRRPGWLRVLRRLTPARRARMGRRDDLVREASRALALDTVGEALRAPARQAQPSHARRTPRRRHRSSPPPITPRSTRAACLSPQVRSAPRLPALQHPCSGQPSWLSSKASLPLCVAALRFAAHSCTVVLVGPGSAKPDPGPENAGRKDGLDARVCAWYPISTC